MGSWGHSPKGIDHQDHSPLETFDWAAHRAAHAEELRWRNATEWEIRCEMEKRVAAYLERLKIRKVRREFPKPMKRSR